MQRVNLPIGTSDFERIRKSGCYYIDKTGLIGEILNTSGVQVMLITLAACDAALRQIEAQQYAEDLRDEYDEILCYGIAFYKKRCLVKREPN